MPKPKEERGISIALKKSSWDLIQRALDLLGDSPEKEEADALNHHIDNKVKEELARRGVPKQ